MIIKNGKIITWETPNQILEGYAIKISDGIISEIIPENEINPSEGEEIIDARSQYIMPGNICAHTHFYGAFSRGMGVVGKPPSGFPEILSQLWWRLDRAIYKNDITLSSEVCLIDAIRHGTTTLIDHHASPEFIEGSLDVIAETVINAGVRASLCYEVTDRCGQNGMMQGIEENVRFMNYLKQHPNNRLAALFGLHAGLTLSNETLAMCKEKAPADSGFHVHVAEHSIDEYESLQKYGMRVVDRLDKFGILNNKSILAHAVHIDAYEMELIKMRGSWVSHQPRSNMNNAVGVADVDSMLRLEIPVCLGNDGFSNSMWDEWKSAYLVHKLWHRDPRKMPADEIATMAIYNNGRLASQMFNNKLGIIEPGAEADLIFVEYKPYTDVTIGNLPWHIVFGFRESMITSTMVAGKFLMKDRELLTLDEDKIMAEAKTASKSVWQRYSNLEE
ncbi:MAG: putative aminohydrolase SsnA [Anaerolineae bacterium]|nr:putative aminohydrolase SsnA [Anaerolineae bacterium]